MEKLSPIETAPSELSAEMLRENLELIKSAIGSLSDIRQFMQKAGSGGEVDSAPASLDLTSYSAVWPSHCFQTLEQPSDSVACIPVIVLFHGSLPCHVLSCCTIHRPCLICRFRPPCVPGKVPGEGCSQTNLVDIGFKSGDSACRFAHVG